MIIGTRAQQSVEASDTLAALSEAIEGELSPHQREVLVAITLNGVPIDVLAERLNTTRGALYKTLHDARQKLRAALCARGLGIDGDQESNVMTAPAFPDRERLLAASDRPRGPELTCDQCFEQLDRYVELELADADADAAIPGMRAHLEGCSACAEDRDSLRALLIGEAGASAARTRLRRRRARPRAPIALRLGKTAANHDAEEGMNSISAVAESNGHAPAVRPSR